MPTIPCDMTLSHMDFVSAMMACGLYILGLVTGIIITKITINR